MWRKGIRRGSAGIARRSELRDFLQLGFDTTCNLTGKPLQAPPEATSKYSIPKPQCAASRQIAIMFVEIPQRMSVLVQPLWALVMTLGDFGQHVPAHVLLRLGKTPAPPSKPADEDGPKTTSWRCRLQLQKSLPNSSSGQRPEAAAKPADKDGSQTVCCACTTKLCCGNLSTASNLYHCAREFKTANFSTSPNQNR